LLPVNDELTPFRDNFIFRNLAFDPVFLDLKGRLLPESDNAQDFYIAPAWPPRYLFNQVVTNGEIITSLLSPSESKWVYMAPRWISEDAFGIYPDQSTGGHRMEDDVRNVYGLPIVSEVAAWGDSPSKRSTIHPGGYLDGQAGSAFIYAETARPALETTEYLFYDFSGYWQLHLPGQSEFDPHDTQRPLLITGIGKDYYYVYGWAKQSLLNGYPGVYGFLGQYFEQALVVGPSGEITTNSAGLLTEYGDFFSTYPGQAALITMPDLDTGERGTGIVHVIKLQLDVNHDGNMELDLTSPDNTSEAVPFRFWVNNDWDYSSGAPDVGSDKVPGDRDCRNSRIESQRDLEDFARLWICGVPSLPTSNGYQVTLSWADVSRGHPTLRLFKSVETNGGTDYLTQPATAAAQSEINSSFSAPGWSLGTVSPSQAFTFEGNLFSNGVTKCLLFEGVENGYGRLILTISKNGQTIATTDAWLDLRDIKNMYQRVRVTPRDPNGIPSPWTFATTFNESLASVETGGDGLDFIPAVDEERKVTVFVHGSNLSVPSAIENAETMFKRLYWQGYKGRFALFYWNTLVGTWNGAVPAHYNYNEFRAFKYGLALKNYVETELPANYTKNVIGHSMGNVVIASALYPRGNMPGMSCRNVIMMQAAIPASCFDPNIAVLAELANLESPEKTPDV
jgi:hypothetical protein